MLQLTRLFGVYVCRPAFFPFFPFFFFFSPPFCCVLSVLPPTYPGRCTPASLPICPPCPLSRASLSLTFVPRPTRPRLLLPKTITLSRGWWYNLGVGGRDRGLHGAGTPDAAGPQDVAAIVHETCQEQGGGRARRAPREEEVQAGGWSYGRAFRGYGGKGEGRWAAAPGWPADGRGEGWRKAQGHRLSSGVF